jgi:YHS domain-containing protein
MPIVANNAKVSRKELAKMTGKVFSGLSILSVALLIFIVSLLAEEEHAHDADHDKATNDKARCAVDGMMMKPSAMTKITLEGRTYYFCNQKQAQMFKANPDKYLKMIPFGHLTFNLNLMAVDEYKEMMNGMGMGNMKMEALAGKTHRVSVYLTQHSQDVSIANIELALQITDAAGNQTTAPLAYNKMMKVYDGFVAIRSGGKIGIVVTTPSVEVKM